MNFFRKNLPQVFLDKKWSKMSVFYDKLVIKVTWGMKKHEIFLIFWLKLYDYKFALNVFFLCEKSCFGFLAETILISCEFKLCFFLT